MRCTRVQALLRAVVTAQPSKEPNLFYERGPNQAPAPGGLRQAAVGEHLWPLVKAPGAFRAREMAGPIPVFQSPWMTRITTGRAP